MNRRTAQFGGALGLDNLGPRCLCDRQHGPGMIPAEIRLRRVANAHNTLVNQGYLKAVLLAPPDHALVNRCVLRQRLQAAPTHALSGTADGEDRAQHGMAYNGHGRLLWVCCKDESRARMVVSPCTRAK